MTSTIYSIGHSNRSIEQLLTLLHEAGIRLLVDVRSQPQSQRHPQFEGVSLRAVLEDAGLQYHWAGRSLGGLRTARAASPHIALAEDGLRGYADHMGTEIFKKGVAQLINLASRSNTAVLCAERLPEQCHRQLLADYLLLQGLTVVHLIDPGERRDHQLSAQVRRESAQLIYDRLSSGTLDL
jgi:uncharacterized protein (DUF488 family)